MATRARQRAAVSHAGTTAALHRDLDRGRQRLESLMGDRFFPVFTPPWNRCTVAVLRHLRQRGYAAVSRSRGSRPASPRGLADLAVDIDLHTRKDEKVRAGGVPFCKSWHAAWSNRPAGSCSTTSA